MRIDVRFPEAYNHSVPVRAEWANARTVVGWVCGMSYPTFVGAVGNGWGRKPAYSRAWDEVVERLLVEPRKISEVDRIDPALTRFRLRDERLRALERGRDIDLSHARGLASGAEPLEHRFVPRPVSTTYPAH